MKAFIILIFFSYSLFSQEYINDLQNQNLKELETFKKSFDFYVIGDWGRHGYFNQKQVAETMHEAAFLISPSFIISTGDNFYPDGVASTRDPAWNKSFEDIYSGYNLWCDWWAILGNHDIRGSVQAQIDYTNISRRWNMPNRYYYFDKKIDKQGSVARFIFIDTNPFNDAYHKEDKYEIAVKSQDTSAQIKWLISVLESSKADWNIVIGHHPLYTSGKRADDRNYIKEHLEYILEKYNVGAYFAGHEHHLQHTKPKNKSTHHFISGAGSAIRPISEKLDDDLFLESVHGFLIASLSKSEMLIQFVDKDGKVIYKNKISKN